MALDHPGDRARWLAEALNTAIERLADAITVEPTRISDTRKDVAAGAVLTAAIICSRHWLTIFVRESSTYRS